MGNKEKAVYIVDEYLRREEASIYDAIMEMAEWKDGQFMRLINDKLDYARAKIDELHDKQRRLKYEGMRKVLLEIKKEIENGKGNG